MNYENTSYLLYFLFPEQGRKHNGFKGFFDKGIFSGGGENFPFPFLLGWERMIQFHAPKTRAKNLMVFFFFPFFPEIESLCYSMKEIFLFFLGICCIINASKWTIGMQNLLRFSQFRFTHRESA